MQRLLQQITAAASALPHTPGAKRALSVHVQETRLCEKRIAPHVALWVQHQAAPHQQPRAPAVALGCGCQRVRAHAGRQLRERRRGDGRDLVAAAGGAVRGLRKLSRLQQSGDNSGMNQLTVPGLVHGVSSRNHTDLWNAALACKLYEVSFQL